jgi:hypothetical protein
MTKKIILTLCLVTSLTLCAQNIRTLSFGKNTLTGTVILKTLIHPIKETPLKNCMVLKLNEKVKFKATYEGEDDLITDEIRIYGDEIKGVVPNVKYKNLINKKVIITANIVYAPSGNYPLLANIIEDFTYKINQN